MYLPYNIYHGIFAKQAPKHNTTTTTMNPSHSSSTAPGGATTTNAPAGSGLGGIPIMRGVEYRCGDCGAKNMIKGGDPVRCRQCGFRILYKTRTRRCEYDISVFRCSPSLSLSLSFHCVDYFSMLLFIIHLQWWIFSTWDYGIGYIKICWSDKRKVGYYIFHFWNIYFARFVFCPRQFYIYHWRELINICGGDISWNNNQSVREWRISGVIFFTFNNVADIAFPQSTLIDSSFLTVIQFEAR